MESTATSVWKERTKLDTFLPISDSSKLKSVLFIHLQANAKYGLVL